VQDGGDIFLSSLEVCAHLFDQKPWATSVQRIVHPRIRHQSGWTRIQTEEWTTFGWTGRKIEKSVRFLAK
jgi:hypothetical protein